MIKHRDREELIVKLSLAVVVVLILAASAWYYSVKRADCKDGTLVRGIIGLECIRNG